MRFTPLALRYIASAYRPTHIASLMGCPDTLWLSKKIVGAPYQSRRKIPPAGRDMPLVCNQGRIHHKIQPGGGRKVLRPGNPVSDGTRCVKHQMNDNDNSAFVKHQMNDDSALRNNGNTCEVWSTGVGICGAGAKY